MITYKISTGEYFANGVLIGVGYAGREDGLNNPLATFEHNVGPLPVGNYYIQAPVDLPESVGEFAIPLTPDPANDMGVPPRSGFFNHGRNAKKDVDGAQLSSDGCPIADRAVREIVATHAVFEVVA